MTNNHQLLFRLSNIMLEKQQHVLPLDELFEDKQIGSFVRNIQIDSPYQQLIFDGVLTETIKEERIMVTFTIEGYFHYVLGEVIEQKTLDKDAKALFKILENNNLRGIIEGVERCLIRDVEKNKLKRLMKFVEKGGQALEASVYPLAKAFLIFEGNPKSDEGKLMAFKNQIRRVIYELLAIPSVNGIEVLEKAINKLTENQNNRVVEYIYQLLNEILNPKSPMEIKLLVQGIRYINLNDRSKELDLLYKLFSKQKFRNPSLRVETFNAFGIAYYNLNSFTKSISILKKCIYIIRTRNYSNARSEIWVRLCLVNSLVSKSFGTPKDLTIAKQHLLNAQILSKKNEIPDYNYVIFSLSATIQKLSFSNEDNFQKFKLSIKQAKLTYGLYHPATSISYYNYASLVKQKSIKEAEKMAIISLKIQQNLFKEGHPITADVINLLGQIYIGIGNNDKAYEYLNKSLDLNIRSKGEYHQSTALSYFTLGIFYLEISDSKNAIKNLTFSLKIQQKIRNESNPLLSRTYSKLASAEMMNDNFNECLKHSKKALKISFDHNEANPGIIKLLNNLSYTFFLMGDKQKTLLYYEKELKYRKKFFHLDVEHIVELISKIVGLCSELKKIKKAIAYGSDGLHFAKRLPDSKKYLIPILHNKIGVAYYFKYDNKNAEKHYIKSVRLHKKNKTFKELFLVYRNLARLYFENEKYKYANNFYTKSYQLNSKYHGPKSEDALTDKKSIAIVYMVSGNYSKAKKILENILHSIDDIHFDNVNDEFKTDIKWDLACNYVNLKNYKKALLFFKEVFKTDPGTGGSTYYIGYCYEKLKNYQKSIKNYILSAEIRKTQLGIDSKETHTSIKNAISLAKETNNVKLLPNWMKKSKFNEDEF